MQWDILSSFRELRSLMIMKMRLERDHPGRMRADASKLAQAPRNNVVICVIR